MSKTRIDLVEIEYLKKHNLANAGDKVQQPYNSAYMLVREGIAKALDKEVASAIAKEIKENAPKLKKMEKKED